jgi:restriction system protein
MSDIILDYSESITDNRFIKDGDYIKNFYQGWCPYCHKSIYQVHQIVYEWVSYDIGYRDPGVSETYELIVKACECGWWNILRTGKGDLDIDYNSSSVKPLMCNAILKTYDVKTYDVPLEIIRNEIKKRPSIIHLLDRRKLEDLVGSVLNDFIGNCKVYSCGYVKDAGIDLLIVEADTTLAIQVRGRYYEEKTEPVYLIREFLGATLLKGYKECIYVTTAHDFSKAAKDTADIAISRGLVNRFELINKDRFLQILNSVKQADVKPWQKFVNMIVSDDHGSECRQLVIPDKFTFQTP